MDHSIGVHLWRGFGDNYLPGIKVQSTGEVTLKKEKKLNQTKQRLPEIICDISFALPFTVAYEVHKGVLT